ncbi:MAG: patatin-like phospholipase family protein [Bacteroidales bacterium]|nr:patatin-like phospholipase family protein [Bacteroidales bacterium]
MLKKKFILISIISIFLFISFDELYSQSDSIKRPKIGLVLSGGGAKGLAHIGSLKIIEKYNIPIDYITGTSMGSIIGALYSMGYSAAEIENIARAMNWSEIFEGTISKKSISIEEKNEEGKYILEIPFEKWKPVIPRGMISGQLLEMELARLTWAFHGKKKFNELPIPFKCIATNIETGEAVVLDNGYLPDAIRASMSIPTVFSPVIIDNQLLVDGGMIRNLPASDAKKMGADIIIAINVGSPLYKKSELNSMLKIMDQAASFRNAILSEEEKKLCDILISPNIEGYSAGSFDMLDSLIINGEKAALENSNKLKELENKLSKYPDNKKNINTPPKLYSIFINRTKVEGLKKVSRNLVASKLQIKDSSWLSINKIEESIKRLYGSKHFEKVNYRIIQNENENILFIRVEEKPFSIFKLGVNYNNYFNASLLLNATFRNIIGEGSRLIIETKLGSSPEANIKYSTFTKFKPSIGFNFDFGYYNLVETRYMYADSINLDINKNYFYSKIALSSSVTNSLSISLGSEINYKTYNIQQFDNDFYSSDKSYIQFFGKIYADTYDNFIFPNSGMLFKVNANLIYNELTGSEPAYNNRYWKADITYLQNFPLSKKFNLCTQISGATIKGKNIFIADYYYIGGQINFKDYIFPLKGFRFMEYSSPNFLIGGLGLRFEAWKDKYFSIYFNSAQSQEKFNNLFKQEGIITGAALSFGIKTILGPIEIAISKNDQDNNWNSWIQLGFYF